MPLLRQCLLNTLLVRLRAIARFWEIQLYTRRQREVALELAEAMVSAQSPGEPVAGLVSKARRELEASRTEEAYWWAGVALNGLGMTDAAVAAASAVADGVAVWALEWLGGRPRTLLVPVPQRASRRVPWGG